MGWQFRRELVTKDTANEEFVAVIQTEDDSEICVGWGYTLGSDENGVKHAVTSVGVWLPNGDQRPVGLAIGVVETDSASTVTTWQAWANFAKYVID